MKNGKRLTKKQKQLLVVNNLNPNEWLVTKKVHGCIEIVHRETGLIRGIKE
jgi:hypothetical protein